MPPVEVTLGAWSHFLQHFAFATGCWKCYDCNRMLVTPWELSQIQEYCTSGVLDATMKHKVKKLHRLGLTGVSLFPSHFM